MKKFIFLALVTALLAPGMPARASMPVPASARQSHAAIGDTVLAFVRAQTRGLPGKVSIQVGAIDRRIVLPECAALEAFLPAGAQLNGNSRVGVRCNEKNGWSVFVPVTVKVSVTLLTANRPLQQGHVVRAEDIGSLPSETMQAGTLTDPAQVVGKVMKFGVGSGQLLRQDMVRDPYTVTQGQTVQLQVKSQGFSILSEGKAMNNAAEGQSATARTSSGQSVSGIVRGGNIEISQ